MNKKQLIEEMEFVKNSDAEINIVDDRGNEYFIEDFGTDLNNSHISILIKNKAENISNFADYLIENASCAFEHQDRELLEKVLRDYNRIK